MMPNNQLPLVCMGKGWGFQKVEAVKEKRALIRLGLDKNSNAILKELNFLIDYLYEYNKMCASYYICEKYSVGKIDKRKVSLITECFDISLDDYLISQQRKLSWPEQLHLITQVVGALAFLERAHLIHPRLIPKDFSVSLDAKTVKLIHLENACFIDSACRFDVQESTLSSEECFYASPELIAKVGPLTASSHTWNLALIIGQIFIAEIKSVFSLPGTFSQVYPQLQAIIRKVTSQENPIESLLDLLSHMLCCDPEERYTVTQVLKEAFFREGVNGFSFLTQEKKEGIKCETVDFHLLLGEGSYGFVYTGRSRDGEPCAIKMSKGKRGDVSEKELLNEMRFLRVLQEARHVVQLWDLFTWSQESEDPRLCIVLEKWACSLREILGHTKGFEFNSIKDYARQLTEALDVLEKKRIMHLDIKPENIFLSEDRKAVAIGDFGSACFIGSECFLRNVKLQSLWYRAPEILLEIACSMASDMWSLGAVLVECLIGSPIFPADSEESLIRIHEYVLDQSYAQEIIQGGSKSGRDLYKWAQRVRMNITGKKLEERIRDKGRHYEETEEDITLFREFILSIISYDKTLRPKPKDLLLHPFLRCRDT